MQLVCDCLGLLHFSTGNTLSLWSWEVMHQIVCQVVPRGRRKRIGFCGRGEGIPVNIYRSLPSNFIRCFSLINSVQLSRASIQNDRDVSKDFFTLRKDVTILLFRNWVILRKMLCKTVLSEMCENLNLKCPSKPYVQFFLSPLFWKGASNVKL